MKKEIPYIFLPGLLLCMQPRQVVALGGAIQSHDHQHSLQGSLWWNSEGN